MDTTTQNCVELAGHLGLKRSDDDLFVGRVRGFPVGLKFIEPGVGDLLLFQIRHWLAADAPELKALTYDSRISKLIAEKKIEIEFADRMAWLSVIHLDACLAVGPLSELLDSILSAFQKAGLIGDPNLCHYCRKQEVSSVSVADEKVVQICADCLNQRVVKRDRETATSTGDAVPILLLSPFAALVGTLLWAGLWIVHTRLFERLNSGVIFIPRIVMAGAMVVIGLLVGGPVGWIIKLNRRRGKTVSAAAAIFFSSLAVLAGEILFVAWLIWREFQVASLSVAFRAMPAYYLGNDPLYLGLKAAAAIVCVVIAYELAKPAKARLQI